MIDNVSIVDTEALWTVILNSRRVEANLRDVAEEMDGMTTEVYFKICANHLRKQADGLCKARVELNKEVT